MEITEVKVYLVDEEKLKAFVSIVLDKCFMINDIKVIQGREGLFISMPSRRKKNGDFKDVAHPLNNETRSWMEESILGEYGRLRAERARRGGTAEPPPPVAASAGSVAPAAPLAAASSDGGASSLAADSNSGMDPESASSEKSLEEVQQHHLSDSFWSVS